VHCWSTLNPVAFLLGMSHTTHCSGGWVGPRVDLEGYAKKKSCLHREFEPRTLHPMANCNTDYAVKAPLKLDYKHIKGFFIWFVTCIVDNHTICSPTKCTQFFFRYSIILASQSYIFRSLMGLLVKIFEMLLWYKSLMLIPWGIEICRIA
jgi:hypothetical protein